MNKIKLQKVGYLSSVNEQRKGIDIVSPCWGCMRSGGRAAHIILSQLLQEIIKNKARKQAEVPGSLK